MWVSPEALQLQETILLYLEEIGCCTRCTLRLMGEKSYSTFFSIDRINEKLESFTSKKKLNDLPINCEYEADQPPPKKTLLSPCVCCVGVLQQGVSKEMIDKIINNVRDSGHHFERFVLRLTVPPTIELREHLLLQHLEEKFSEVYTEIVTATLASVRDAWKWALGPHIGRTFSAEFNPFCDFSVSVFYSQNDFEIECLPLEVLAPSEFPNRMRKKKSIQEKYSRASVLKALDKISWAKLKLKYTVPPAVPPCGIDIQDVVCKQESIYLAGRYNKYSRKLSQTPWFVDGKKRMENSVEEFITGVIQQHIVVDKIVFSSSGREDVDVRMLGDGRPFILELLNARKTKFTKEEYMKMQTEINAGTKDIAVRDVQRINKDQLQKLKEGEEFKKKTYLASCCLKRKITEKDMATLAALKDLEIEQRTPIRVLHRRTLAIRPRTIHSMEAEITGEHTFQLRLVTQAGTYVKEFVHGDFGRTVPNIGTLLESEADITELDVEEIQIDWPPKVD